MKSGLSKMLIMTAMFETILSVHAFKCWKCIAHDCNANLEDNYKAAKVKCHEGQMCMKVRYRMFDNVTHYDSVIRTCTDSNCDTSSIDDFFSCIANPAKYMIGGCTLRSCCDDKDLCNISSNMLTPVLFITLFTISIAHLIA
ncbi:uncharacterized protein LOC132713314 [Ruditapes philippinarum]|uniref:uncharacterized protein LOC132713314 n=1 Tax=Ruditapes philippinarum TaxID=129788 RepID=UPI00295AC793|nr:uncharacterized protein LOC132713314 [Ruditapes philippinarum]